MSCCRHNHISHSHQDLKQLRVFRFLATGQNNLRAKFAAKSKLSTKQKSRPTTLVFKLTFQIERHLVQLPGTLMKVLQLFLLFSWS